MWTTQLGWTVEELQLMSLLDLVHPEDRQATLKEFDRLVNTGGETIAFENRCRHQNGSYRWLRWSAWPVPERQLCYAIAQDITLQKRQEQEILEIADREKERLGLELHDGLCQSLAGIAALSSTLSRRLAQTDADGAAAAAEITQQLNEAIRQARDLAHGFNPIGLNNIGLQGALETLALNTQQCFRVSCTLACDPAFPRLHCEVERQLFRIAQEAVNNAVTHGRSSRIEISLSLQDKDGILSIRDNGVGMPENPVDSDGIGLHTMFYRTRLIGGSLKVRQRTVQGMAVICVFPLLETSELCMDLINASNGI